MIYKFSDSSKKALENAEKLALEMGHNFIGSEHILYGIAQENKGIGYKVLKNQNIGANQIYLKLKENIGQGKITLTKTDGFTPRTKRIIENAFKETEKNLLSTIGTETMLLSILKDKENMAYKILEDLNADTEKMYNDIFEVMEQIEEIEIERKNKTKGKYKSNILEQYGVNLNELAEDRKIDLVIGREKEINRIIQILSRKTKNNPCLIGEPGVGKTAIIEGLAKKIVNNDVPEILKDKIIFNLDLISIIAGAKYRGDFEDRIKKCIQEVKKSDNIILFIDEIHTIVGAGAAEGAIDAANILKPILARGEIQLIGATTIDEYTKYIEKDAALERRFCPINIEEPSIDETISILKGLKKEYEKHHNVLISDEVIEESVKLADRYIFDRFMPDKAIDILDESAAKVKMISYILPTNIKEMLEEVENIKNKKNIAINNQSFEEAAKLRDEEIDKRNKLEKAEEEWKNKNLKIKPKLEVEDVKNVISNITKIPIAKISNKDNVKLQEMEAYLKSRIIGQDEAIKKVCKAIIRSRVGINDPNKPISSFMFLGPTGVGKTELTKVLSSYLFGSENNIIRLDMSEYMESYSISKIIGSPPGYVGFEEETNLTKKIRKNPYSIILLDEIEKAHPDVLNILLQILDEGILTDSKGRKINFRNTIIIMTSNFGAEELITDKKIGFGQNEKIEKNKIIINKLKKEFRPEFINRIDDIIIFNKLEEEDLLNILDIILDKLRKRIKDKEIDFIVDKEFKQKIIKEEIDPRYGAREIKRKVQDLIENEIALNLINKREKTMKFLGTRPKNF